MNQSVDLQPKKKKIRKARILLIVLILAALIAGACKAISTEVPGASGKTQGPVSVPGQADRKERTAAGGGTPVSPELTGDVPETAGPHEYSVLVIKGEHKVYLLDHGKKVAVWGCAIGKGGAGQKKKSGDNMTPTGIFRIDEIDDASSWTHDFHDGKGVIEHAYGPWFLSLDTSQLSKGQWDGIGIHGTHDPQSIGTNASEGCIRLRNEDLKKLHAHVRVGTLVEIRE
jgi:lipoprotein-anchoring transpeptidase ErfK/SrfK